MARPLLIGGLVGGVVLFVWGAVSWMVLPWHNMTLNTFTNEDHVASVLNANTPNSGVYVYPGEAHEAGLSDDEQAKAHERAMEKMKQGPFVFVSYNKGGVASMATPMMFGFLNQVLVALLITGLLLCTKISCYWSRVGFVVGVTFTAGVLCHVPYWNWWGFSAGYTAIMIADLIVAGLLLGLVLAKIIKTPAGVPA